MVTKPNNYAIWPAILKADEVNTVTITATERAFFFVDGASYELTIIGVNNDETDYHDPVSHRRVSCVAQGGYLKFDYKFEGEQEFIFIIKDENQIVKGQISAYAVKSDLYGRLPLKGDLHTHSYRSDGKRDPGALAGYFREYGYDFFALTDHNRFFPGCELSEAYEGVKIGVHKITGEEVHYPGNTVHIVHVGGKDSVTIQYVLNQDVTDKEMEKYIASVPKSVPEQYRERYAKCKWVTDKIHEQGGLAIYPHPYWRPGSKTFNVNEEFSKILFESKMFDAFELAGGMEVDGINTALMSWMELKASGLDVKVVGSSDVHSIAKSTFNNLYTMCFACSNDTESIIQAIKDGYTLAVETSGDGYGIEHRYYGDSRFVMLCHFLEQNFQPTYYKLCAAEGVAMRAYLMGEASKELVEALGAQANDYRDRFLGKKPPVLPTKQMLEFEDKWRKTQIEKGPNSKGSSINVAKPTFQI